MSPDLFIFCPLASICPRVEYLRIFFTEKSQIALQHFNWDRNRSRVFCLGLLWANFAEGERCFCSIGSIVFWPP